MARISAEDALGVLSIIGKLSATIDEQNEYMTQQSREIERLKAPHEHPPQTPEEQA